MTDNVFGKAQIIVKQAAEASRIGEGYRWPACIVARKLSLEHRYQHDGVKEAFAKELRIKASQLDNLSFAFTTYRILRHWIRHHGASRGISLELLHTIRRNLRFTHFSVIGQLMAKYEWNEGPPLTLEYLQRAMTEHLTIDKMRQMVEADQAFRDGRPADGKQSSGNLDNLDSLRDLAREQRKHAQMAGARRAVVVSVSDNGSGFQVTLGTERRNGVPVGAEAWLVVIGGET